MHVERLEPRCLLCFNPAIRYAVGDLPRAITAGDFNGDSRVDIAVTHEGSNTLSILRGNGNGTFQTPLSFGPTFVAATSMVTADFNRDGRLDLILANGSVLRVLLGNGNGTFAFFQDMPGGTLAMAVGDFNHDGKADVGATFSGVECNEWGCYDIGYAGVLLGNGDGTFSYGPLVRLASTLPEAVVLADANGDGELDLIAASKDYPAGASVLLGNGDGTLRPPVEYAAGSSATAITAADLNRDNKIDLIVANGNDATLSVLLGNGDGTFQNHVDYGTGSRVLVLTAADFDADGLMDVLATDLYGSALALHRGNGDGTLSGPPSFFDVGGTFPIAMVPADFNGDGRLDAATANYTSDDVSILMNDAGPFDRIWVGPTSGGSWMIAANWSPVGVPGWTDRVLISGGSAVVLNAGASVGGLTLSGGATLTVQPAGNRTLRTLTLSIAAGSRLNLNDSELIVDYAGASPIGSWNGSSYTGVTGMIRSGRNGGAWNASGIVTSMSNIGDGTMRALGVGEAAALLGLSGGQTALWNGLVVDATTVIVKYTYAGDIDLNGELNGDDYFYIDSNVHNSGVVLGYSVGDIDLNGVIDGDDYFWIDSQILSQGAPL